MITWLASYPKSGNTFVRHVIEATVTGNLDINNVTKSSGVALQGSWHTLPIEKFSFQEQIMFAPAALFAQLEYRPVIVTKTHHANFIYKGWQILPAALTKQAIYIVRDPRDVCISHAEHFGVSIDESISLMNEKERVIGRGYPGALEQFLSSWSNHVQSYAQTDTFPVKVFKYEKLLSDSENQFKKLLALLGITPTDGELERGLTLARFDNVQKQEEESGFIENNRNQEAFFKRGTSGHWREILSVEQAERIVADHGEFMARMGYPLK